LSFPLEPEDASTSPLGPDRLNRAERLGADADFEDDVEAAGPADAPGTAVEEGVAGSFCLDLACLGERDDADGLVGSVVVVVVGLEGSVAWAVCTLAVDRL
jgi:hypothetical protein